MISVLQDVANIKKLAIRYVDRSLEIYKRMKNVYGVYYYFLSIVALLLAVIPGAEVAFLQLLKDDLGTDSTNWFIIGISICSSLTSLISGLLSFFVVRVRYKESKTIYYKILAEYLLFNTKTGIYASSENPGRDLFARIKEMRQIKPPAYFTVGDDAHDEDKDG